MRILNVTQSYAPFYEFGGPPVKVEALSNGLARRGHEVTVLTADWGFESRQASKENAGAVKQSPLGWTRDLNGVESIYLPTRLRYRAVTWNPAVKRFCRARLAGFQVVHIFGLYDLLGPAVARECRKRNIPYVIEPIGMFVPMVRHIFLKRAYHAYWGKEMLRGAAAVIVTSEQEMEELTAGGILRKKLFLRRNGVVAPRKLPAQGEFRAKHGISADALLILFLGRLSKGLVARSFCAAAGKYRGSRALVGVCRAGRVRNAGAPGTAGSGEGSGAAGGIQRRGLRSREMGSLSRRDCIRLAFTE